MSAFLAFELMRRHLAAGLAPADAIAAAQRELADPPSYRGQRLRLKPQEKTLLQALRLLGTPEGPGVRRLPDHLAAAAVWGTRTLDASQAKVAANRLNKALGRAKCGAFVTRPRGAASWLLTWPDEPQIRPQVTGGYRAG